MKIEKFEMMRMQCLYEREVEFDLSETTVLPLRVSELLDGVAQHLRDSEDDLAVRHIKEKLLSHPLSPLLASFGMA